MAKLQGTNRIDAYQLANDWDVSTEIEVKGNKVWVPARPIGYLNLIDRLKLALDVFRGKADALYWRGQGDV